MTTSARFSSAARTDDRISRLAPAERVAAPYRPVRSKSGRAVWAAFLVVGGLLLVGGTTFAMPMSASAALVTTHGSHPATPGSVLLAAAKASAARGNGPGGVAVPQALGHPGASPNVTFGIVMTYDVHDGYVVAVSLNASAGPFNNTYGPTELTWKFTAGNWSVVATTGHVPATLSPGLVYDARDGYVLLYGGRLMGTNASWAPVTNQTWGYKTGVWSNLSGNGSTPAPTAVDFPNLVYDGVDEYVLLYDELGLSPGAPNGTRSTTWSYAAGIWTNRTLTAGTPPEWLGAMAYDSADQYVLDFGGYTMANQLTNATWTFAGGKWTNVTGNVTGAPSGRINFGIAYDSLHKEVLVYGGLDRLNVFNGSEFSNETWAYATGSWSRLSASGSPYNPQSMVYDPADNETVLLGSSNITVSPPNVVTWTFSAGNWSVAAPAFVTKTRTADVGHAFTLSVTTSPNAGGLVYRYSGLPTGCTPQNTPSLTCVPTQVGTFPVVVSITGSAGFAATARTTVRVNPSPAVLGVSPSLAAGEVGIPMGFVVNATPGSGNLTYSYVGLPTGCASANAPQLLCVPTAAGAFDVTANVADAIGVTAFGVAHTTVAPALQVLALRASAVAIDAGQSLQLSATLVGGVGPNGISYTGLPAGCATASVATLSCRPTATGSFVVGVGATDALGASASGTTTVVVNPLPSVASFVSSSASVLPGASVQFTTTPAGGTAPFTYQYAGVPTGCQAGNAAVVTCASVPAGNYTVTVTIVDATGATATASTSFRAAGPASPAPSGSTVGGWFGSAGFWGGLAVGAVAIVAAVAIGGYRLRLARQGEAIVQGLQTTDSGPFPAELRDSTSAGREDDLGR